MLVILHSIRRGDIQMSINDKNTTNSNEFNEEYDSYDYLDSLMEDVMGHEEATPAEDSSDNLEHDNSSPIHDEEVYENEENKEDWDDSANDSWDDSANYEEEYYEPVRRRAPLFQSMNADSYSSETAQRDETGHTEARQDSLSAPINTGEESGVDAQEKPARRRGLFGGFSAPEVNDDRSGVEEAGVHEIAEPASEPEITSEEIYNDEYDTSGPVNSADEDHFDVNYSDPIDELMEDFSNEDSVIDDSEEEIVVDRHESIEEERGSSQQSEPEPANDLDDMFDGMLSDLTEVLDDVGGQEPAKSTEDSKLGDDVIVPLNKPGMEDVIVTPDGRSLAEMIPGLRSGNKPVSTVVKNIKDGEEIVEVGDKKFSDDRYTKHIKEVEDKRKEQDKRRALSNKFLQRNSKFTEQEKIIFENLGITSDRFTKLMGSKELTPKEKEEIIGLGKYGAEKFFKGRRYRTTVGDTAMLEFLAKFKFANTRILRWISNEPQGRTWRKLNRLRDNGLVEDKAIIGIPNLWGATPAGIALSGYNFTPGLRPMPKMITVSSTMGVNYLAACLWFNSVNVLNLDDFPANNRVISTQEDGRDRARGEMLVSELEIRSSLGKEIAPGSTTMQTLGDERLYDVISATVRQAFAEWDAGGRVGESPEFALGNEFMWVLYPVGELTMAYHVPDLVVKRERGPQGEPRSIAVELERHEKDSSRYDKIMRAYKLDDHVYEKVIWVTPNMRIARALEKSANDVGFTNYEIIPIITEDGVFNKPDIWMI